MSGIHFIVLRMNLNYTITDAFLSTNFEIAIKKQLYFYTITIGFISFFNAAILSVVKMSRISDVRFQIKITYILSYHFN